MTAQEATALGYKVIKASAYEVGLVKNGKRIRTWWNYIFNGEFPDLEHPKIQATIKIQEDYDGGLYE